MMAGKDNRGTTLAEMIVTFALIGIFLVSAAGIISSAVILHSRLSSSMYAQSVGETLIDKLTGELAAAQPKGYRSLVIGESETAGGTLGEGVAFYDREGNKARCFVREGRLVFSYEESVKVNEYGEVMVSPEREWMLDDKAYMGYQITDIQFAKLGDKNVLEITIKIKNLKTGFEYTVSRCTGCYNFKTESDYSKIVEGNILSF
ncbi:MAG: hypothetical protein IJ409_04015 [Lachnospiraceae bacterium]|nr:hypothetical protein [Lachnospiraceae bacterium]